MDKKKNHPTMMGVGYFTDGKYELYDKSKKRTRTVVGDAWYSMLKRCYSKSTQSRYTTYIGCTVCEEWHSFQNFAKWYSENIWNEEFTFLDKDILIKGNKLYSPNTCIIVDNNINNLFTKNNKNRGDLLIGVVKRGNKFASRISICGNMKTIGNFYTQEEAFTSYKLAKESYIKQVADEYKSKYHNFPQKLYDAMYSYEVEIAD